MSTKKTFETTGGDTFIWLLPGILCGLGTLVMIGLIIVFWVEFPDIESANKDEWWSFVVGKPGRVLGTVLVATIGFFLGRFAVIRLALNPTRGTREDQVMPTRPVFRLACLWLSQTGRVLADWCLRVFVWLELAWLWRAQLSSAWYLVTAVYITPFILLAPSNGA